MLPSIQTVGVPELLEMILENARPQDVLLWQGVNKTWQAAIQRSPRIQEKLFFKVEPCEDKDEEAHVSLNPLMNLFLLETSSDSCTWFAQDAFDGKFSYQTASWKQMLITSPAVTELEVFISAGSSIDLSWSIVCHSGITIGQLANSREEWSSVPIYCYRGYDKGKSLWVSCWGIRNLKGR